MTTQYAIGEFSDITNVSIYTLRYYEKENLINPKRMDNGRRTYSEEDIAWIQFIKRLKETGMSIKEIHKYAELRAVGEATLEKRMEILKNHRCLLQEEIAKASENLNKLDEKIIYYENAIDKK